MATITKEKIFKEIDLIFKNNTVIGDYEDREKNLEERNISLPILKGLYPICSVIVYLERKGYNNTSKLQCAVNDYFADFKRKFDTVLIGMPNWSTPNEIRNEKYSNLAFYCIKETDVSKTVKEYTTVIMELAEKRIGFIIDGSKNIKPRKKK